jgi:hypothetical protein
VVIRSSLQNTTSASSAHTLWKFLNLAGVFSRNSGKEIFNILVLQTESCGPRCLSCNSQFCIVRKCRKKTCSPTVVRRVLWGQCERYRALIVARRCKHLKGKVWVSDINCHAIFSKILILRRSSQHFVGGVVQKIQIFFRSCGLKFVHCHPPPSGYRHMLAYLDGSVGFHKLQAPSELKALD